MIINAAEAAYLPTIVLLQSSASTVWTILQLLCHFSFYIFLVHSLWLLWTDQPTDRLLCLYSQLDTFHSKLNLHCIVAAGSEWCCWSLLSLLLRPLSALWYRWSREYLLNSLCGLRRQLLHWLFSASSSLPSTQSWSPLILHPSRNHSENFKELSNQPWSNIKMLYGFVALGGAWKHKITGKGVI